jgi:hypothetical protein
MNPQFGGTHKLATSGSPRKNCFQEIAWYISYDSEDNVDFFQVQGMVCLMNLS